MKITEIVVAAGRTFNHPHETYSNLRPMVTLKATVEDGDDATVATRQLQQQAEGLVEDHKQQLLRSLEELHQMTERQSEVRGLQVELDRAQRRLEEIRKENPSLTIGNGNE
jgi:hypothetical protein